MSMICLNHPPRCSLLDRSHGAPDVVKEPELLLEDDLSSSWASEDSQWPAQATAKCLQCSPAGCSGGVPCLADELELHVEQIEEETNWRDNRALALQNSLDSLSSCAYSMSEVPRVERAADMQQPSWATDDGDCGGMQKPSYPSCQPDVSWEANVPPVPCTPVLSVVVHQPSAQMHACTQKPQQMLQWQNSLKPGCQKGIRCDREDGHRVVCNTHAPVAAPFGLRQKSMPPVECKLEDGVEGAEYAADPFKSGPLHALVPLAGVRTVANTLLDLVPQPQQQDGQDGHDSNSHEHSNSQGSDSSSEEEVALLPAATSRSHRALAGKHSRPRVATGKHAADSDLNGRPPAKIPRCSSVSSMVPAVPQKQRRAASARSSALTKPRKRGSGVRGTGPLAATAPGQHCYHCNTQVTPVWRAGPMGPKTLCNACGVRYMKGAKSSR